MGAIMAIAALSSSLSRIFLNFETREAPPPVEVEDKLMTLTQRGLEALDSTGLSIQHRDYYEFCSLMRMHQKLDNGDPEVTALSKQFLEEMECDAVDMRAYLVLFWLCESQCIKYNEDKIRPKKEKCTQFLKEISQIHTIPLISDQIELMLVMAQTPVVIGWLNSRSTMLRMFSFLIPASKFFCVDEGLDGTTASWLKEAAEINDRWTQPGQEKYRVFAQKKAQASIRIAELNYRMGKEYGCDFSELKKLVNRFLDKAQPYSGEGYKDLGDFYLDFAAFAKFIDEPQLIEQLFSHGEIADFKHLEPEANIQAGWRLLSYGEDKKDIMARKLFVTAQDELQKPQGG